MEEAKAVAMTDAHTTTGNAPAKTWFELIEDFEPRTAKLRAMTKPEQERACEALTREASGLVSMVQPENFPKLMVWHADKLYRIVNAVSMLDGASLLFLGTIGRVFAGAAREHGRAIAYIVDNVVSEDRLRGIRAAFNAAGFVVASPELLAAELARADGRENVDLARYEIEAIGLALRVVEGAVADRHHCLWVSGMCDQDAIGAAIKHVGDRYVGVFRNEAPVDGSSVDVFRGL